MDKLEFDEKKHTVRFFDKLIEIHGSKSEVARYLGIKRTKLYRWMEKAKQHTPKTTKITYEMVIAHVKSKEPSHQTNKILRECEGPKQRQKRLAMDLIDQINEILNM